MPDPSSDLVAELRRRKVFRAAFLYLVVALAVLEGADVVFGTLMLPPWIMRAIVGLALLGFPVTLVLAWWLDLTPDGIRRAEPWGASRAAGAGMLAVVLALSGLFSWLAWGRWLGVDGDPGVAAGATAQVGPGEAPLTRVAVLYFDDHSPNGDLGYLTAGLTEELIHQLSQVRALDVVSRNGVKLFRDAPAPLDSMVAILDAGTFVEGSVQRSGDLLRVTVQLIDGASGIHLVSRTLERPWGELFALQDALAEEVTVILRERLGEAVQLQAKRQSTTSVEAWEAFQRGERVEERMHAFLGQEDTASVDRLFEEADDLLRRAAELDPGWIEPTVHRGWLVAMTAVELDGEYVYRSRDLLEARTGAAMAHAERALEQAPEHAGALELRGFLNLVRWHQGISPVPETRQQAESDLEAAVSREPARARAWRLLSNLALKTGDFEHGRQYAERALDEDAFLEDAQDIYGLLYETALNLEDVEEASRWCEEGHRRFPRSTLLAVCGLYTLASVPGEPSAIPAAWALHRDYVELTGTEPGWNRTVGLSLVAAALARAALPDSARAVMARARSQLPASEPNTPYFDYYEAYVATLLGETDRALQLLGDFVAAYPSQREFLPRDWWFRPLWDDDEFRSLMGGA
jgi:TolB-like protein/tetratricopeptide (TPR) repeat protein